ncbi:prevent-host-death family protein [Slackia heliotrinireducens]|uniref:Antitoxin n=1 Tax=Slackia heliotrinireducens (strain ATCC 29202 / DSM 20476 / NCTC 11029 / RHS 1) TaxID=471855 RepID=C7N2D6_SLAHD|nr:type II toxin-antitoxin system Phd/YefM family antitoxin [Slackia heliotrinireducens]ACV21442.1 prevent-host-death family protein [Slackia heliotrinireducens DSM 20476]VEG98881.1 prevent-host-death family protein [Slackia heliotrinireducens]
MQIMPVSELRNHYSAVEEAVSTGGPVFLTKNGYGSMVVMSMEQYENLTGNVEAMLDAADRQASSTTLRYSHDDVFGALRGELDRGEAI